MWQVLHKPHGWTFLTTFPIVLFLKTGLWGSLHSLDMGCKGFSVLWSASYLIVSFDEWWVSFNCTSFSCVEKFQTFRNLRLITFHGLWNFCVLLRKSFLLFQDLKTCLSPLNSWVETSDILISTFPLHVDSVHSKWSLLNYGSVQNSYFHPSELFVNFCISITPFYSNLSTVIIVDRETVSACSLSVLTCPFSMFGICLAKSIKFYRWCRLELH